MRSYLEIFIDVKDGKKVDYEELRLALLFCRDILFFTEYDLKNILENCNNDVQSMLVRDNMERMFNAKKAPIEKWWNGNIPKINF